MSDNILSAVLTFSLLAGGTAAIGSEMFNTRAGTQVVVMPQVTVTGQRVARSDVITMPMVAITGHRDAANEVVMLPQVTVTGRREATTQVAIASEPARIQ